MQKLSNAWQMYKQQESPENSDTACVGRLSGSMRADPAYTGVEGNISAAKRDNRACVRYVQRESWTAIYTAKRTEKESAPGADHFRLSQFEKDGKMARMSLIFLRESALKR